MLDSGVKVRAIDANGIAQTPEFDDVWREHRPVIAHYCGRVILQEPQRIGIEHEVEAPGARDIDCNLGERLHVRLATESWANYEAVKTCKQRREVCAHFCD